MRKARVPVAIVVRVSTEKQETNRQISELKSYAEAKDYEVVAIEKETVSGRADDDERQGLTRVTELAQAGKIRKVLVHEISRLARKNSVVHRFVETLEESGVSLYWHSQGIETLLPNGKRNPSAGIMLALLAEIARSEVETLRERIKSGLDEARRKGVTLGRPKGTKLGRKQHLAKHKDVVRLLRDGQSVRHAAKISKKGVSTVMRIKAALAQGEKVGTISKTDSAERRWSESGSRNFEIISKKGPTLRPSMTIERFKDFISAHRWQFAHTMKRWPHWYTLRKKARDDGEFVAAVEFIRSHGYDEMFFKQKMRYLDIDGFKYWTMGFVINATILINRAKISAPEKPHVLNPVIFRPKSSQRNFHDEMRRELAASRKG